LRSLRAELSGVTLADRAPKILLRGRFRSAHRRIYAVMVDDLTVLRRAAELLRATNKRIRRIQAGHGCDHERLEKSALLIEESSALISESDKRIASSGSLTGVQFLESRKIDVSSFRSDH
jgi:hypothetical protein